MRPICDFSVIVPVFNNWALTENCLRSLCEHTAQGTYEVIVADNASTDATAECLQPLGEALFGKAFTRVRFAGNRNFGPACNAGAVRASAPLLFFLNNDTILTPGWAPPLLTALGGENPDLPGAAPDAAGPLLLYEDGTVQHHGVAFALDWPEHLYRTFPAGHRVFAGARRFQALTAAALMLRKEAFFEAGAFFPGYCNGFEDVELCLRLSRMGKSLAAVPESRIVHLESRTPGRRAHDRHNERLFRSRCAGLYAPDLHAHGLRDGFAPFVSDCWDTGLRLGPEEEESLLGEAAGLSLEGLVGLTRLHPLWVAGRELLAGFLERAGHARQGLVFLEEAGSILNSVAAMRALAEAAARAQSPEVEARARKRLADLASARGNRMLAAQALKRARASGDDFLAGLYADAVGAAFPDLVRER